MNDTAELNRKPLHRYRNTFRAQDGEIDKATDDGLRAWAIRTVMASNKGPRSDDELAALEDWEWDTRMRLREVAALERIAPSLEQRQAVAEDLNGVCVALERIADALERGAPRPMAALTTGELMAGVGIEGARPHGDDMTNPSVEFRDGLYGFGGLWRYTDDGGSQFALDLDNDFHADSPEELHRIAKLFRESYAAALDFAADDWQRRLDAGEVTLRSGRNQTEAVHDEGGEA